MPITLTASQLKLERSGKVILNIDRLTLISGETLALVGPNGAGKSTLLQVLACLIQPDTGVIELDGESISNGNRLAAIRRMALVFQEALLLDTTVQRNIEIPQRIRGVSQKDAQMRSAEWMHRLGISHLAREQTRKLSGGEAQRASIARALALRPQLLLMDEPFSALDYPTRKGLLIELGRILPETGITTLFVTHDFSEIPFLTRSVAVLFEGRIIREGDMKEILGEAAVSLSTWAPWDNAAISNPSV